MSNKESSQEILYSNAKDVKTHFLTLKQYNEENDNTFKNFNGILNKNQMKTYQTNTEQFKLIT